MFPGDITDTGKFMAHRCVRLDLTASEKLLHEPAELVVMTASVSLDPLKGFGMVFSL